jgi:hypothetical protein
MAKTDETKKDDVVTEPISSLESPVKEDIGTGELSEADEAHLDAVNNNPMTRANDAGIGLIKVLGSDADYVGVAPARDKQQPPISPDGLQVSPSRSTFTPLANVPFSQSTRVKDPKSGKFYFAPDGCTSWEGCHLEGSYLIPQKVDSKAAAERRQGKIDALANG